MVARRYTAVYIINYSILFYSRSHVISRLSMIFRLNIALNRTFVVDSDWRFDNLCVRDRSLFIFFGGGEGGGEKFL